MNAPDAIGGDGPDRSPLAALIVTLLYAVVPGHPDLPVRGWPFGTFEWAGLAALVVLFVASRWRKGSVPGSWTPVAVLAVAAVIKCLLAFAWYPTGWMATYYANEAFQPPIQPSSHALPWPLAQVWSGGATRFDKTIDFRGSFPVHLLNDAAAPEARGESTAPFSVEWRGHFEAFDRLTLTPVVAVRGFAELLLDGRRVLSVDSPDADGEGREKLIIPRGPHVFSLRYRKPANAAGLIRLSRFDGTIAILREPKVLPFRQTDWRPAVAGLLPAAGWMTHGAALLAVLSWLGPLAWPRVSGVGSLARAGGSLEDDGLARSALSRDTSAAGGEQPQREQRPAVD